MSEQLSTSTTCPQPLLPAYTEYGFMVENLEERLMDTLAHFLDDASNYVHRRLAAMGFDPDTMEEGKYDELVWSFIAKALVDALRNWGLEETEEQHQRNLSN